MRRRKTEARIAREADGTLPEPARRELAAQLEASPELAGELELQGQALSLMRQLDTEQAPPALHASVQSLLAAEPAPQPRAGRAWRLAPVAAMAVLVIALAAVLLSGGSSSTPTVNQAALLALREPTQPAPPESPDRRAALQRDVDGISFPYWRHTLGWSTTGARSDHFAGHSATTVFYTRPERLGRHREGRLHDPLRRRPAAAEGRHDRGAPRDALLRAQRSRCNGRDLAPRRPHVHPRRSRGRPADPPAPRRLGLSARRSAGAQLDRQAAVRRARRPGR